MVSRSIGRKNSLMLKNLTLRGVINSTQPTVSYFNLPGNTGKRVVMYRGILTSDTYYLLLIYKLIDT